MATALARSCFFSAVLALALFSISGAANSAPVAMVSDLQGKGTLVTGTARTPLAMLAELEPNAEVELDTGARMVALYLDGSGEYLITGPALVAIRPQQPQSLKGAAAQKRSVLGGKAGSDVRLKPAGAVQGALVMRAAGPKGRIRLLHPSGTRTVDASPEFRWQFEATGLSYRFELLDETGRLLHEAEINGTAVTLPPTVKLADDAAYTWVVSTRLPDGRKYSSTSDFSIAPAGVRQQVASLRPAGTAPVSDKVAYAAWLEQLELKDEARKMWRALAAERPDDARLESLARGD
ncbi:MAG: hypothetical protein JWO70_2658 [Betaproteobacteria bacterium]|nr:hypothetical protein [Betaproteobacteria bacterium]